MKDVGNVLGYLSGRAGVLAHVGSLPSNYGFGNIGDSSHRFLEFLEDCTLSVWQMLPVHPVHAAHDYSPYSPSSAFAGSTSLIDINQFISDGLLKSHEVTTQVETAEKKSMLEHSKRSDYLLRKAWSRFTSGSSASTMRLEYEDFCNTESYWLNDFSLFSALSERLGPDWSCWPPLLRDRAPEAIAKARVNLNEACTFYSFGQYIFFKQWRELQRQAQCKSVKLVIDFPFYVAHQSADVWSHPCLFKLNSKGKPLASGGVPPDAFCKTEQNWALPVYDWEEHTQADFFWWSERFRHVAKLGDAIRVDHFRGYLAHWEIEWSKRSGGRWVSGPGGSLFLSVQNQLGFTLPIIAEDLGSICSDVNEMLRELDYLGTVVLQLLPSSIIKDRIQFNASVSGKVLYTGTHDLPPLKAWIDKNNNLTSQNCLEVCSKESPWGLVEQAFSSDAFASIVQLQDVLSLGKEARMNVPGTPLGNWLWHTHEQELNQQVSSRVANLVRVCGRC